MQAFCFPVNCGPLKYGSLQQKLELKVSALAVDERAQWLFSASKDNALKARRPEKAPGPKPKESDGRRSTTWSGPAFLHLLWLCRAGTLGGEADDAVRDAFADPHHVDAFRRGRCLGLRGESSKRERAA